MCPNVRVMLDISRTLWFFFLSDWCFIILFFEGGYLSQLPGTQGDLIALGSRIKETVITQYAPTIN